MKALNLEVSDVVETAGRFKQLIKELSIKQFDSQKDYAKAVEVIYKELFHSIYWGKACDIGDDSRYRQGHADGQQEVIDYVNNFGQ